MSKKAQASAAPRLKLVIRRLPPNLPEELFWKAVAPWVTDTTCSWKRYVKGRPAINPNDHPMHSRAYCLMSSLDTLVDFHRGFDGHVFRSKAGVEHQAVVEFAPVQKTPSKAKAKADARQGTVDDDPDFKSFIQSLSAPPEPAKVAELAPPLPQIQSTPLLDHLRAHGAKTKRGKNRSDTSTTDLARSATAAINAAASKRISKDSGPVLQAGKGRETVAVPPTVAESKGKGKGKGKTAGHASERGPVPAPKASGDSQAKGKSKAKSNKDGDQPGAERQTPKSAPSGPKPNSDPTRQSKATHTSASGRTTPVHADRPATVPSSPGRGDKGGRGGATRGRGGKSLAERTRSQITDVLAKNAEAGRGGAKGRGRGKGRGGNAPQGEAAPVQPQILARGPALAPDPRAARIDT